MKISIVLTMMSFVLLLSCDKEGNDIFNPNLLTGTWRLDQVTFNQLDGSEINDWVSNSAILNLDENNSYYRNYVSGDWSLQDKVLILNPLEGLGDFYWERFRISHSQ